MAHAHTDHAAPAILAEVNPASLPRATLVENHRSFGWVTEKICGIIEGPTPKWWWIAFAVSGFLASFTVAGIIYLVATGVGVWGHANPVNWAWDIVNFVFWIGIGHAGTLISAILCLLRQKWRTSINRAAEAMTIFAVVCAGIFPVFHVGRVWFAVLPGYLFPFPNSNAIWPNFRSPLEWDVFAVSTYGTVSVLFWYIGLIPDLAILRDRFYRNGNKIKSAIYGLFAMGWRGSNRHWSNYEMAYLDSGRVSRLRSCCRCIPSFRSTSLFPFSPAGTPRSSLPISWRARFSRASAWCSHSCFPCERSTSLEDLITQYHIDCMCKITLATGTMVGYAYSHGVLHRLVWRQSLRGFCLHQPRVRSITLGPTGS